MKKVDIAVRELVGMIERGELVLPEMQRRYVWRAPKVRDLLDSIYRGYPTGAILVWETDQPVPRKGLSVDQQHNAFDGQKMLLDGQQRLTSLSAVLRGAPIKVRGRRRPIDILFNLDHPDGAPTDMTEIEDEDVDASAQVLGDDDVEEGDDNDDRESVLDQIQRRTFVVASRNIAQLPNWVSVTEVFKSTGDGEILKRAGVDNFDSPNYKRYAERLARLRKIADYLYVMQVLERDLSYEEVADIFVRVNSLGVKLRGSDLALAQITARWRDSLPLFEAFQEECEERWFTLDLGQIVRALVVFATGQCKFNTVGGLPLPKLQASWEQAKDGLRFAINFLRTNADIEDESLLTSPMLYIPLAVCSQRREGKLSRSDGNELLYWLLVANARGSYGRGSAETILNTDLRILFQGGSPENLLEPLRSRFGRLHLESADLVGRGIRSGLFSTAFLALKAAGAKDWRSGLGLSLTHQGRYHYIQFHHIFPKSVLRKHDYDKSEINEIANMAFISGRANRGISNKPPTEYFPEIIEQRGEEALAGQAIPLDRSLWRLDCYRDFLVERRRLLAEQINTHLEAARRGSRMPGAEPIQSTQS